MYMKDAYENSIFSLILNVLIINLESQTNLKTSFWCNFIIDLMCDEFKEWQL